MVNDHPVHLESFAWKKLGLTEGIWELMEDCWKHDPADRPVVGEIIARLHSPKRMDNRPAGGWGTDMSPAHFRSVVNGDRNHPSIDDVEVIVSEFG